MIIASTEKLASKGAPRGHVMLLLSPHFGVKLSPKRSVPVLNAVQLVRQAEVTGHTCMCFSKLTI